jgi:hypothetical protein
MSRFFASICFTVCIGAVAGCAEQDPYLRSDVWRPTGASIANLAAQLANPHDLISGRSTGSAAAAAPAIAIDRIAHDQPKPISPGGAGGSAGYAGGSSQGGVSPAGAPSSQPGQ